MRGWKLVNRVIVPAFVMAVAIACIFLFLNSQFEQTPPETSVPFEDSNTYELERFDILEMIDANIVAVNDTCVADLYNGLKVQNRHRGPEELTYEGEKESITLNKTLIEKQCALPPYK
mgnify:CR=1 FL=1